MPWRYSKSEVTIIQAPIKGMLQMDQKTWEKYRGYYSHIKDVARITMEFTTVAAFLEAILAIFNDVGVDVLDLVFLASQKLLWFSRFLTVCEK